MKTLMKAAQITKYSKNLHAQINDISIPEIADNEVLVKVKAAAVNPLEMLTMRGSVKLIHDGEFPLTLGNELAGVIEKVGKAVTEFHVGDAIYTRLPLEKIGAFAEYAAIDAAAISPMPKNLSYVEAAAAPLAGLTAYQGLHEELEAQSGKSVFIPGGSGSFGQMAVPIAKAMGLHVIVSGSAEARERILEMGASQYLDYRTEDYVELLSNVDYVIDTLGPKEFDRELSIIKPGGKLLSLRTGPNKRFGKDRNFPRWKQMLFALAGAKYDRKAKKQNVEYRFIFVRSDGEQLKEVTKIIEDNNIVPAIHPAIFTIESVNEALKLVANGRPKGKVIVRF
ncbi:NADP-dependent oxidoreductase [Bacillus altitudinis]|uniref:NADP-dependent oxidoreductase n=1 Tax=Bacillus altitudinis TaxID=293387 RepID=UPI001C21B9A0|nr:NADP-dependent oxidoreductase [Bacillus altitudinis]MBU8652896.1 NADP-dependent oxidoreductase [Bacillus altitudinis]MBU8778679.1 NADP-dependent oxidoreductase [Bacillus altitudinis]